MSAQAPCTKDLPVPFPSPYPELGREWGGCNYPSFHTVNCAATTAVSQPRAPTGLLFTRGQGQPSSPPNHPLGHQENIFCWGLSSNQLPRTFFILLICAAQCVLRGLLGRLTVLLPDGAGASVGAGHGGQAQAVSRGGGAHRADRRLPLVSCAREGKPNPSQ